jgi:hypothetical protein
VNVLVKGHNYGWNVVSKQGPPQFKRQRRGWDDPVVYFMPTYAPAGNVVLYRQSLSRLEELEPLCGWIGGPSVETHGREGATITSQEIVFDQFGRVRDIVQGPDGISTSRSRIHRCAEPGRRNISLSASTPGVSSVSSRRREQMQPRRDEEYDVNLRIFVVEV